MNRNTVRLFGLVLLVPSVFLGLLPYLAGHTMLVDGLPAFNWTLGNTTLAEFHKDLNGDPIAQTSWQIWIIAVIGEMLLLGVNVFRPLQPNRFKINIRG